jgi:hypothetical protein
MYGADFSKSTGAFAMAARDHFHTVLSLPFDLARESYATAVRAGLIERSLIASAKFGQALTHIEAIALGPLARSR